MSCRISVDKFTDNGDYRALLSLSQLFSTEGQLQGASTERRLTFKESSHRYKLDGDPVTGVTTLIGGGVPEPALI
ncbi:hypothetical protein [Glutamicibacter sp. BW77]|uniref:hypothetical protein n=1 Tax=Glutamicibacter sp. BW77 TaxID=2024402 RepID=UPI000BB7EA9A|nr:hypothetical protein [Glutamicibacter sp. BW77]PCC37440.1 hypothetical protein CIK74_00535 [Glutamicibacter sp. BW77]